MVARRPKTSPRKQPQQERARCTVDALLKGTARVLVREGYDRASTNRIAEVAGVNIGSLYQYFPSKDALISALIDRHLDKVRQVITESLLSLADAPIDRAIAEIVRAHLDIHALEPALHKVLLQQVPRVERLNPILTLRQGLIELTRAFLELRAAEIKVTDCERSAFILVHVIDTLTQAAILERPEYLRDPAYAAEIARVVLRYLHA